MRDISRWSMAAALTIITGISAATAAEVVSTLPELVAAAHNHGLLVYVWNIDDIETLKPYLTMNLDGIGSNRPAVLIEYLKKVEGKADM